MSLGIGAWTASARIISRAIVQPFLNTQGINITLRSNPFPRGIVRGATDKLWPEIATSPID
jgi:hypothetical protein